MLAVPLKQAKGVDWSGPLRSYLQHNYSAETLDKHSASIQKLSTTRERVANANGENEASSDALESYLVMLNQVEPRFPLGEGGIKLSFIWYDALKPSKKVSMSKVAYERACTMFNLAAVLSRQGMVQDRSDVTGLKKACQFFQRAAGIFGYLRDDLIGTTLTGPTTTDLSHEGLDMLYNLMLAQAQACFFEKAIRDQHKPAILAKLAAKAAEFYEHGYSLAQTSVLASTLDKAWASHLEFQYRCFQASAQLQYSKVVHEKAEQTTEGYGEEIARLALASDICESAIHCVKVNGLPPSMLDTVVSLRTAIHRTMDEATENNNKIYMQLVPSKSSLSAVAGSALAKPIVPASELVDPVLDFNRKEDDGTDASIFAGLLPSYMQEAEAMYQSQLSALVENYGKKVQDAAERIKLRLAEANLPAAVEAGDGSNGLPDAVWERINTSVLARGGIEGLRKGISTNEGIGRKIAESLDGIERELSKEEAEDTRCRSTWGSQWTTSSSAELSMHMRSDLARYRKLLEEAKSSDGVLREKLESNLARLEIATYTRSRLDRMFPTSEAIDRNPEVEETREELAFMLVELGTNIQEIERLQGQLVDDTGCDSIASAMMKSPDGPEAVASSESRLESLLKKEIAKYKPLQNEIDKKVAEQPSMLNRVLDKNHEFSRMKNQSEEMLKREGLIAEIDQAISIFDEIACYIAEGEKFYMSLSGRIEQLRLTATDHCYVREIQRKEMESELASRAANPPPAVSPTSPSSGAGGYYPGMSRQASQPYFQPYAAGGGIAQTPYPTSSAPPPYPGGHSYNAPPSPASHPPPAYSSSTSSSGAGDSSSKLALMRSTLGPDYSNEELQSALDGAGGDVNVAVNHLLTSQEQSSSRKSTRRYGMF